MSLLFRTDQEIEYSQYLKRFKGAEEPMLRSRSEEHQFVPHQSRIFPESQLEISRGYPDRSTFQEISRGQSGFFQLSRKFPDVCQDFSRGDGNFQRSYRIFPGESEISRGQSGFFQWSRKFPKDTRRLTSLIFTNVT